jgi:hypothetical protein
MSTAEGAGAQANGYDPWAPNEEDIEFPSGRTYTVRRSLPLQWFITQAMADGDLALAEAITSVGMGGGVGEGAPEDATPEQIAEAAANQMTLMGRVMQTIVEAYFVRPRVYADPSQIPPGQETWVEGQGPLAMTPLDFADGDLEFAIERAFGGMSSAARFRGEGERDEPGAEGGDDGPVLEHEPVGADGDDAWDHDGIPG